MNKNFSQKCAIACQFIAYINREDFREEFIKSKSEKELSKDCRDFLELCCSNEQNFYIKLEKNELPKELEKFKNN